MNYYILPKKHSNIEISSTILDTNKINLNFVDKFNRTIYDYVKKTNIQEFSLLLN